MQEQMKNKIYYSPEARQDLDKIWEHIASELQNPSAAEKTINHILPAVSQLEDFAEIGALLSSIADVEGDYRVLVTGNYLAFYRTLRGEVYVDRILYGRRDYLRILFGDIAGKEPAE